MFDEITKVSLLYDFYGSLLTAKQQEVMRLYHEENYSLAEIATEFSISRQGVHDSLKKAEKALYEYEDKLKLVNRFEQSRLAIEEIALKLEALSSEIGDNHKAYAKLRNIEDIIKGLEL